MLMSILKRGSLALLPLAAALITVSCVDDPTSPAASAEVTPSFVVAALAPINALEGTPVQFYCGTSSDAEGNPLLCQWDFGNDGLFEAQCTTADASCRKDFNHDGVIESTSTGSFTHSWPDQTTVPVRLVVSDNTGEQSSVVTQINVADVVPTFTVRENLVFAVGQVQRANTRIIDPGLDAPWMYDFDWGDGTVIHRQVPGSGIGFGQFHAYADTGTYVVTVTVRDKDGVVAINTRTATIIPYDLPTAAANGPYTGFEGTPIAFSSAGSFDNQELAYRWEFGDGARSFEANPSKSYRDNGSYNVRLIVTDPSGLADTAYSTVVVDNLAPTGSPRVPSSIREGSTFSLIMNGTDLGAADRTTLQYSFECGAGQTAWSSTNNTICPAFTDQGTRQVSVSVRDKDGAVTTYERTATGINSAGTATLTPVGSTTITVGTTLNVEGRFTDPGANDGPFLVRFLWGDGGSLGTTTTSLPTTMPTTPLTMGHTYTRAGTYTAYLLITDKDGANSRSAAVTVTVVP